MAAAICVPLMLAVATVGFIGTRLSWRWAQADRAAGVLADRLVSLRGVSEPDAKTLESLAEIESEIVEPSWTRSSSDEIAVRVAALTRAGLDPAREERLAVLLDAGRHASPAHPAIQLPLAWRSTQGQTPAPVGGRLGLSRDVLTLTWSARELAEAGEPDRALDLFHRAIILAERARLESLPFPAYRGEPDQRRFDLPYEAAIGPVVREMIDASRWEMEAWGRALTEYAVVPLAAARVLRQRGSPDADRALALAIECSSRPSPDGCDPAVHIAAGAEALAMQGKWVESADRYREAVAKLGRRDGETERWMRRSWAFNMADLYARIGDPTREREAQRLALGSAPNDEITKLIVRAKSQDGGGLFGPAEADAPTDDQTERTSLP